MLREGLGNIQTTTKAAEHLFLFTIVSSLIDRVQCTEAAILLQYCAKVTQAKCANFVLCFTRNFQESSRESSSDNSRS